MEPALNLKYLLEKGIVCQPRTSRHKQYTIILPDNNEIIYKGPYTEEKANKILERADKLRKLTTNVIFPVKSIKLPEGMFLIFPNVNTSKELKYREYEEKMTGDKYRVLERTNLVKFSDYLRESEKIDVNITFEFFMDFIYLYLFSVGDVHFSNCLYNIATKQIYIIDVEENRSKEENREDFYFSLSPSVKVKQWWLETVRPFYPQAINILNKFANSDFGDKAKKAIGLLSSKDDKPDYNKMKVVELKEELKKKGLPISGKKEDLIKRLTNRNTQVVGTNLGKMKYGGYMGESLTFSGYAIDVVKSAMQKYIRRNIPDKALISMIELYRMPESDKEAITIQSNMFNRVAVIASEDIGVANVGLVEKVLMFIMEDSRNLEDLYHYIIQLSNSPKTRIMSHLWRTYATLEGREEAKKHNIIIDNCSNDVLECRLQFEKLLKERNHQAIYVLSKYIELIDENKKQMVLIWEGIRKINNSNIIGVLEKAYFKFSEKRPFLMMAITFILYENKLTRKEYKEEKCIELSDLIKGDYEFTVDDYCIDKHTKEGRENGKDRKEFVIEGSKVEPQDKNLFDEIYYKIYCDS